MLPGPARGISLPNNPTDELASIEPGVLLYSLIVPRPSTRIKCTRVVLRFQRLHFMHAGEGSALFLRWSACFFSINHG